MRFIRYLVSIIDSFRILALGGFLLFAGGAALVTVWNLQTFFGQEIGPDGATMGQFLFETDDMTDIWFADPTAWLIIAGYFAVGLLLFFLAARSLIRRVRRGRPKESEGQARGPVGRAFEVLIYGGCVLFGLAGIVLSLIELSGPAKIYLSGTRTAAVIERTWSSVETKDKTDTGYFAAFTFSTVSGETIAAETSASAWFVRTYGAGKEVEVIYDPGDPRQNVLPAQYDFGGLISFFGFRLLLIVFGIWGLRRAARLKDLISAPEAVTVQRLEHDVATRRDEPVSYSSARVERAVRHVKRPRGLRRRPRMVN